MKTILKFLKSKFLWVNILVAVLLVVVGLLATGWWLDSYTRHGEGVEVPDVSGLYVEEAELLLRDLNLRYEVVDSVYLRGKNPGEIAEQSPSAGTLVKKNRKIYVTVNQKRRQMVSVPMMKGESRRKAQTNLKIMGFDADSVMYKPYEFDDEVLGLLYDGVEIDSGMKVPDGAQIVLVVGRSDTSVQRAVPNLLGLTMLEVVPLLDSYELVLGLQNYDVEPLDEQDRIKYRVYSQIPAAGESVYRGKVIDIKLSKTKKSEMELTDDEEDFF